MKEHLANKNLHGGVWRAFASRKRPFTNEPQRQLYEQLETSSEIITDSVFSFLATTASKERIVGKIYYYKFQNLITRLYGL